MMVNHALTGVCQLSIALWAAIFTACLAAACPATSVRSLSFAC